MEKKVKRASQKHTICGGLITFVSLLPTVEQQHTTGTTLNLLLCNNNTHTFKFHKQQIASSIPHHALLSFSTTCKTNCWKFRYKLPSVSQIPPETAGNWSPGVPCPHAGQTLNSFKTILAYKSQIVLLLFVLWSIYSRTLVLKKRVENNCWQPKTAFNKTTLGSGFPVHNHHTCFCGFPVNKTWWSSARSSAKKEWKLRPVSLHGKIKRRHIPLQWIMINSTRGHCWSHSAAWWLLSSTSNSQECQGVSQRPMCQGDECWKLLGKRIRSVYVGLMAHCQLFKCANFLKLQSPLFTFLPCFATVKKCQPLSF